MTGGVAGFIRVKSRTPRGGVSRVYIGARGGLSKNRSGGVDRVYIGAPRRCGGDAVVKDRRPAGAAGQRHYAPAVCSGAKMASGKGDVSGKTGDCPPNPTIYSRIASRASWVFELRFVTTGTTNSRRTRRGRRACGSRQGDAFQLKAGKGPLRAGRGSLPSCSLCLAVAVVMNPSERATALVGVRPP